MSTFSALTLKCTCLTAYIFRVSFFWCSVQDKLPPGFYLLFIFNIHSLARHRTAQKMMFVCLSDTFPTLLSSLCLLQLVGQCFAPDMECPSSVDSCQQLPGTAPFSLRCHFSPWLSVEQSWLLPVHQSVHRGMDNGQPWVSPPGSWGFSWF